MYYEIGVLLLAFVLGNLVKDKIISFRAPPAYHHEVKENGAYHSMIKQLQAVKDNVTVFSDTVFSSMGLNFKVYHITDPILNREMFLKSDNLAGHIEMNGWFATVYQYRQLAGAKKEDSMKCDEVGIVRDMDTTNPESSQISRHCRRRFMEWTAKKNVTQNTLDWIKEYSSELNVLIEQDGLGGAKSIETFPHLMKATTNIMLTLGLSYRLRLSSEELSEFVDLIKPAIESLIGLSVPKLILLLLPSSIRNWIPLFLWPKWVKQSAALVDKIFDCWNKHDEHWKVGDEQLCFIETMKQDVHDGKITKSDAITTLLGMIFAAGDTTATNMQNVLFAVAKYPKIQEKVFKEIQEKNFDTSSIEETPYLRAIIAESFRYMPSVYRSLIHSVTVPTKVGEYGPFPRGTMFCTAFTGIFMNSKYFPDPFVFDPSRFLDQNGNYKKNDNLIPFNVGKRSCPGQITAMMEMCFFILNILKEYEVVEDSKEKLLINNTEESWHNSWGRGHHGIPNGHFMMQKHNKLRFIPRKY